MLDLIALKSRAQAATGLSDFGDAPLDDGLEAFCTSLKAEAGLTEARQVGVENTIVATLSERLKIESCLARHPDILEQTIESPIFVFGLPRTGTTALSQFLSEDPHLRSIRRWECNETTPPPEAVNAETDPRIAATRAAFAARDKAMPTIRSMLPVEASDPSEHGPLLNLTFRNLQVPSLFRVPSYTDWLLKADMRPAFAYMARVLKLLQWKTPAPHWNLKNPPDIFVIDAILSAFPDARLVWTHRDPADSIPSVCSLLSTIRTAGGEDVDKSALGRMVLTYQSEGARRAMAIRQKIGADRIVNFYQKDLSRDTFAAIETLYHRIGLPFTEAFHRHLEQRLANRPRGKHGKHSYSLSEFGLTLGDIRSAFGDYQKTFEVPVEVEA